MAEDRELIAAVGNIGRAPVRPGIVPTQQNIATPSTLTPNSGVRVDEGATPTPTSVNGAGEQAPRSGITQVQNPTPQSQPTNNESGESQPRSSGGRNKKNGNSKTTFIAVAMGICLIGIIILLIVLKGKGTGGPGDVLTDPTPIPNGDLVQDFQEYEDPFGLGGDDEWIVSTFEYTEEEYADLRRVGYTSSEIEEFKDKELAAAPLIEQAEQSRKMYLEETLAPYYDGRSEAFKELENQTWVGLPLVDADALPDSPEDFDLIKKTQTTINTDFEKVEPRGNQLFIKIYTDRAHDNWVYYQCTLYQWDTLEDYGNIVIEATISTFESETTVYEDWKIDNIVVY